MPEAEVRIQQADYETAMQVARRETTPPNTPRVTEFHLTGQIAAAGVEKSLIPDLIDTLVSEQHLVRIDYHSRPGEVPADQQPRTWLAPAEMETLLRWIRCEAASAEPDRMLIGLLNQERDRLRGVTHDSE